jgi:hypothetical protein
MKLYNKKMYIIEKNSDKKMNPGNLRGLLNYMLYYVSSQIVE